MHLDFELCFIFQLVGLKKRKKGTILQNNKQNKKLFKMDCFIWFLWAVAVGRTFQLQGIQNKASLYLTVKIVVQFFSAFNLFFFFLSKTICHNKARISISE